LFLTQLNKGTARWSLMLLCCPLPNSSLFLVLSLPNHIMAISTVLHTAPPNIVLILTQLYCFLSKHIIATSTALVRYFLRNMRVELSLGLNV
jgi:hypothetical protein